MNEKLNGWNNNLTPFDGIGGKPGYHEKLPTMTPEQKKAKEIFEKYRKITYIDEYGNENYERLSLGAAKACAIEEVKALIAVTPKKKGWSKETLLLMEANMDNPKDFEEPDSDELKYWKQVLTEIEKL